MSSTLDSYSDDSPQTDPEADKLGTAPFAERLAELLVALEAPKGYVIGLSGAWGSGKTSALNYVRAYIERLAPERLGEVPAIITIEFRPWLVSGHQDLVAAFFKVLAEQLGHAPPRWKVALSKAAGVSADLSGALTKIGYLTAHLDAGGLMGASIATNKGLKKLSSVWSKEPSLQKTYEELADILRYAPQKVLVVIDDIDRLQPDEIQAMMSMVKTVGQLPNVVYLLSYDRNIVWPALQERAPAAARINFAEKLVQQEVALPTPGFDSLLAMLLADTAFLAIDTGSTRWGELVEVALRRWLQTPRDVLRLTNNLRFAWSTLQERMDPIDYLAIEGARTFDKVLFDWIRDNAFLIFGGRRYVYKENEFYDEAHAFKASLPPAQAEELVDLAIHLFPHLEPYFHFATGQEAEKGRTIGVSVSRDQIIDRRGLNFDVIYDAYFRFHKPLDVVGAAQIAAFLARSEDEGYAYSALSDATKTQRRSAIGWTYPLFEAVTARLKSQHQKIEVALLRAALRVFSDLATPEFKDDAQRPSIIAWQLVEAAIPLLPKTWFVDAVVGDDTGLTLYARTLIAERVRRRAMHTGLADKHRERLVEAVKERIQRAADDGSLGDIPSLNPALMVWMGVSSDVGAARQWIDQHIDDLWLLPRARNFFFEYLVPMVGEEVSFQIGSVIPAFFDLDRLQAALIRHVETLEGDEQRRFYKLLAAVEDAIRAKAEAANAMQGDAQ